METFTGHHSLGLVEPRDRQFRLQSAFPPFIPGIKTATSEREHRRKPASGKISNEQRPSLKWGTHTQQELLLMTDREEKKKKQKQAALMLRTWEIVMEKEKEQRHSKLRERVNLQHQLMNRNEEYFQQRKIMKSKLQNQKLEDEHIAKQEMISDLQQHVNRALKKSRRLRVPQQKTIQETEHLKTHQDEVQCSSEREQERIPTTSIMSAPHLKNSLEPKTDFDNLEELFTRPENKILQLIGVENHSQGHVKIEDMWMGLKAHADREIHPMKTHLRNLKKQSTPSVKECLELYQQPVQLDHYTGKPVPLTKSLSAKRHISPPSKHYAVKLSRSSAGIKSRCGYKMAERMRSNSNHEEIENNANWFVDSKQIERPTSAPGKIRTTINQTRSMNLQYLTNDGRVISSTKKERNVTRTQEKIRTGLGEALEPSKSGNWEPLSLTALNDYSGVQSRLVSGDGHFKHGRVGVWKPLYL